MARVIGYVKSFEHGTFFVKDAKGHSHQLKAGEAIHEGELVYGAKNNSSDAKIVIDVTLQGAGDLVIAGNGALNFDTSLLKGIFVHDDAVVYVNSVKDALALNGPTVHQGDTENNTDVTHGGDQGKEDETAAGNVVTDTEHTADTFAVRDALTQDVSTTVSGTGTADTSSTSTIQLTTVNFVPPTITVMVPLSTNDKTPTIIGTSNLIGGTVALLVTDSEGNTQTLYTTVQTNGTYSIDVPKELTVGDYTVKASITDGGGNSVNDSDQGVINPLAPTISLNEFADVTNDNTPTISGTSDQIGGTVTLIVTSPGGIQMLYPVVQSDGTFSIDIPESLQDGTYNVEARVTSIDGIMGEDIENALIDTKVDLTVRAPDNSNDDHPTIYGTSDEIGATIFLKVTDSNGHVQELTAKVNSNHTYSVQVTDKLADGAYTVEARVQDAVGNVANATDNGSVDTVVPTLTVDVPENTTDTTPTITGTSDEIGATVTLIVTDSAGNTQEPFYAQVDENGNYSIDVPEALSEGSFTVNASISDSSNNETTANDTGAVSINYAPTVIVTVTATPEENTAAAGDPIATSAGSDEDGDTLVYSLTSNPGNVYAIDPVTGAVSLTQEGADLINGGGNLPSVEVTVTDPSNVTGTDSADVSATTQTNDAPTISVSANDFTEDNGVAVGATAGTYTTSDEENGTLTVTFNTPSDHYILEDGVVKLTQAGVDVINAGGTLDAIDLKVTDNGTPNLSGTGSDTPVVSAVADIPNLSPISDINVLNEGATLISTGNRDILVNQYDMGAGVSQANLEAELGLPAGSLDNRFDSPANANVNDLGYVDIIDGKTTEANYDMSAGMAVTWDYTFKNGEDTQSEVANGFNDQVILVVTDPNGVKSYVMVDSSENKFPNSSINGSYSYTATMDGKYTFDWLVLNSGDAWKDSSLSLSNANFTIGGIVYSTPIALTALAAAASLNDTDGSETLSVTISGIPSGAILTNGTDNGDGSWTLTADQLSNLFILPPDNYTGTMDLTVTATATEISNGDIATATENFTITVSETTSTVTTGSEASQTLNGTDQNDLIRGYAGDDTVNGGNGDDMIFGGAGNDTLDGQAGSDALYGGVGNDTLIFDAADSVIDGGAGTDSLILLSGTNIDFSALDSSKITNIETIDLSQNGDHSLTNLSYADVINMTDSNHTLTILGDSASDKVQLNSTDGWSNSGTVMESGHTYDVYTSHGTNAADPTVTVKVENTITDTVI